MAPRQEALFALSNIGTPTAIAEVTDRFDDAKDGLISRFTMRCLLDQPGGLDRLSPYLAADATGYPATDIAEAFIDALGWIQGIGGELKESWLEALKPVVGRPPKKIAQRASALLNSK